MQATAPIVQKNERGLKVMCVWSKKLRALRAQLYILPPQPVASSYAYDTYGAFSVLSAFAKDVFERRFMSEPVFWLRYD